METINKWARLEWNAEGVLQVAEIITFDPAGMYTPDLKWEAVPAWLAPYIDEGYTWTAETGFMEPSNDYTLHKARALKQEEIHQHRKTVETAQLTIKTPDGSFKVDTKEEDINKISVAIQGIQITGMPQVDFKSASGWVTLTLAGLLNIAGIIAFHVQESFSAERAHCTAVDALPLMQIADYDYRSGHWPSAEKDMTASA